MATKFRKEYDPNKVARRKRRPIINIICEGKETEVDVNTSNINHYSEYGCGCNDYERSQAMLRLLKELSKGRKSGEENGWLTLEKIEKNIDIRRE